MSVTTSPTVRVTGRHRLGTPGLIPVSDFVSVPRRGLFARIFGNGRHRLLPTVETGRRLRPAAA